MSVLPAFPGAPWIFIPRLPSKRPYDLRFRRYHLDISRIRISRTPALAGGNRFGHSAAVAAYHHPGFLALGVFPLPISGANAGDDGYDTLKPVKVHTIGMHQTILLVDDDPQIRALCRTTLEETGYFVSEASNGKEALEAIKETVFDLIVLDLCMPDQDGFEFLHAVRAELPKLKIIVISGFMTGTMLPVARLQGAVATLAKPFSPDSLLSAVSDVLGTKDPVGASD